MTQFRKSAVSPRLTLLALALTGLAAPAVAQDVLRVDARICEPSNTQEFPLCCIAENRRDILPLSTLEQCSSITTAELEATVAAFDRVGPAELGDRVILFSGIAGSAISLPTSGLASDETPGTTGVGGQGSSAGSGGGSGTGPDTAEDGSSGGSADGGTTGSAGSTGGASTDGTGSGTAAGTNGGAGDTSGGTDGGTSDGTGNGAAGPDDGSGSQNDGDPATTGGPGNPGNDRAVGGAGEQPGRGGFGRNGDTGKSQSSTAGDPDTRANGNGNGNGNGGRNN